MTDKEMLQEAKEWRNHIANLFAERKDEVFRKRLEILDWLIKQAERINIKGLQDVYNEITKILLENDVLMNITPPRPYLIKKTDEERINKKAELLIKERKYDEHNKFMKESEKYKLYFDQAYKYTNFHD